MPLDIAIAIPQLVADRGFDKQPLRRYLARAEPSRPRSCRLPHCQARGRPDQVTDELRTITDAGADLLLLHPLYDDTDQMERLAADVIPSLTAQRTGRSAGPRPQH
jgi:hypothetical protein